MTTGFTIPSFLCPQESLQITNTSLGNISSWAWTFDNGSSFNGANPPPQSYITQDQTYTAIITQIITNAYGCSDTLQKSLQIINNCFIAVPNAFTPNGDGLNDYLYPLNAYKAIDLKFSVYNRFGQRLFYSTDWTRKWDGTFKQRPADPGTYVWTLTYINTDDGRKVDQKGTVLLIR
jgi:gliding motility-associated-like protein